MKILNEFKKFAMKGNVLELATGVVIGTAFGKIVNSLVNDIIMPLLGLLIGKVKFAELKLKLAKNADGGDLTLNYGNFIQVILDFIVISLSIFLALKIMTIVRKRVEKKGTATPPAAPPVPTKTELLLQEIRDLLREK